MQIEFDFSPVACSASSLLPQTPPWSTALRCTCGLGALGGRLGPQLLVQQKCLLQLFFHLRVPFIVAFPWKFIAQPVVCIFSCTRHTNWIR